MHPRSLLACTVVVLFATVTLAPPRAATAQPMIDRVEPDALIYVGWRGADALQAQYKESHFKAVLEASNLPQTFADAFPKLMAKIGESGDPKVAEATAALLPAMWKYPTAVSMAPVVWSMAPVVGRPKGEPSVHFTVVMKAGAEAQALSQKLQAVLPKDAPITVSADADTLEIEIGDARAALAVKPGEPTHLGQTKHFLAAISQVQKDPALIVYVNAEAVLHTIDDGVVASGDMHVGAMWPRIRDASGLVGLKQMIATSGFDGKEWGTQAYVEVPARDRNGLLSLMTSEPLPQALLDLIPASASTAGAGRFDAAKLVAALRAAAPKIDPDMARAVEMGFGTLNTMVGFDVQNDFLGSLGDEWAYYTDRKIGGPGLLGQVIVNRLRNPAKFEISMGQVERIANGLIATQLPRDGTGKPEFMISIKQGKLGELTYHYAAVPGVAPCWAVKGNNLYIALYPQVLQAAIDSEGKVEPITKNAQFMALQKRLAGTAGTTGFSYVDLPQSAPDSYGLVLLISRLYVGLAEMAGMVDTAPMSPPPLPALLAHLAPAGGFTWTDDAGWHARSITPFPGADMLGAGGLSQLMVAQEATLAGVLLPALAKTKQRVAQVQNKNQIRQIEMSLVIYANDNKNKLPDDLGQLVTGGYITPDVVIDPATGQKPPPDFAQWEADKKAQWVNDHSGFVYLGKGRASETKADRIDVLEKPGATSRDGMLDAGFNDGHVERLPIDDIRQRLKAQGDTTDYFDKH